MEAINFDNIQAREEEIARELGVKLTDGMVITDNEELIKWALVGIKSRLHNMKSNLKGREDIKKARELLKRVKLSGKALTEFDVSDL